MRIAIGSCLITACGCVITATSRSAWLFFFAIFVTSIGGGVGSAVTSLGLALIRNPNEAGRLFGAWAVLSTVSSSIVGPFLFTFTFSQSAATAPSLVFYVVVGTSPVSPSHAAPRGARAAHCPPALAREPRGAAAPPWIVT